MTMYRILSTPLGTMIAATRNGAISGLWFEEQKHFGGIEEGWREDPTDPLLEKAVAQIGEYFRGERREFDLPLDDRGTAFQRSVWKDISKIAFGATTTYGALARRIGRPESSRAVGAATGRNPFSIIVPCHRVLASNGALTGYAGGIDKKRALLALENGAG